MVHQHFMLIPRLSVADNIVLGDEPRHRFHYDRRRAEEQVNEVCRNYGIAVDPKALVQDISLGMQQPGGDCQDSLPWGGRHHFG